MTSPTPAPAEGWRPSQDSIERAIKALEFAKGLACDAERLIGADEGRRLKSVLNNIRHGYLSAAIVHLSPPAPTHGGLAK